MQREEKWLSPRHVMRRTPCDPIREEDLVEDQDKIQGEDVEAHRKRGPKATDEGTESGSEDFELHKRRAHDEGGESSDDDVELHKKPKLK